MINGKTISGVLKGARAKIGLAGVAITGMAVSAASATFNLTSLWDFIQEIIDHQDAIFGIIILGAVVYIVRKFGSNLGNMLNVGGHGK